MSSQLVHLVSDALLKLKGDPTFLDIHNSVVESLIPEEEQGEYRDNPRAIWNKQIQPTPHLPEVEYEGKRVCSFTSADTSKEGPAKRNRDISISYADSRFILASAPISKRKA